MAHITPKYFSHGDSLSSSDYNGNVDAWNNGSALVDDTNIRDQGLDVHNFEASSCYDDLLSKESPFIKQLKWAAMGGNGGSKDLYEITIPRLNFYSTSIGHSNGTTYPQDYKDQRSYVLRTSLWWWVPLAGSSANSFDTTLPINSYVEFKFNWYYSTTNPSKGTRLLMTKTIRFEGSQISVYKGSGNISFSTIISQDLFGQDVVDDFNLKCRVQFEQSEAGTNSIVVLKNGQTHDDGTGATTTWNSDEVAFYVENWQVDMTGYLRAE